MGKELRFNTLTDRQRAKFMSLVEKQLESLNLQKLRVNNRELEYKGLLIVNDKVMRNSTMCPTQQILNKIELARKVFISNIL